MKIYEASIKRPVTVFMCVLIVLVLGMVSFSKVSLNLIPNIDFPIAVVVTSYSGVGPEEMENIVTKNIENAIATVSNIKAIQSQSSGGSSIVIAEFNSGTDMDFATLEMREKIDLVKRVLPDEVEAPMVIKMDPSMIPILSLGITNGLDEVQLKKFVEDKIEPRIESLDGVASVNISGGKTREIKVDVDPEKLSGYSMSLSQVSGVLQTENLNLPGGTVEYGDKNLLIRSTGEFKSLNDIRNIPIILPTGNTVYIRDIAEVKDDFKTISSYTRMNGKNSIGVVIQKQTSSNTVKVVNLIKEEIKEIEKEYPDVKISLVFDQAEFIEKSLQAVSKNAIWGALFAVLILYIFLKNIRTTLIIATAIPLSIVATFVLIYFSGITLNLVSMGGLALGVGMLIDNAIVVLENVYRHRIEGNSRVESASKGTGEVAGAIIASTLTTIIVFLPIAFAEGIAAQIFKEMAMTVAFSLFASLVVALTLIPMLCSKYLKVDRNKDTSKIKISNKIIAKSDDALKKIYTVYGSILDWVLKHRKTTIVSVIGIFVLSLCLIPFAGAEFFPAMDQGQFTVDIQLPQGTVLEQTNKITTKVEKIISERTEIEKLFVSVGSAGSGMESGLGLGETNRASIQATLKPLNRRGKSTMQVVDEIRKQVKLIPGADIKVTEVSSTMGGSGSSSPVAVKISGPDLEKLKELSQKVEKIVRGVEGTRQVEATISQGRPETQIYIDRDKASYYGLGTAQIASVIRTAVEGKVATRYKVDGEEFDIRVQLPKETRKNFEQLKSIKIISPYGVEVPLLDVVKIDIKEGPVTITREDQQRYVTISSQIFGRDIGNISKDIKARLNELSLPSGYEVEIEGQNKEMIEAFTSLLQVLLLAILLVYMIMASQFESLLHPFIIMFSLPLAFTGSILGLVLTQRAFCVPSFIGVIMLAGIVVNNAIVFVDYVNILRRRGMECREAILQAGPTRLRPILMTSLTTILALIPLAIGVGEGAEMQAPFATVVIGGLLSSTVLTLIIIPIIYTFFDDIIVKVKKRSKKQSDDFSASMLSNLDN